MFIIYVHVQVVLRFRLKSKLLAFMIRMCIVADSEREAQRVGEQ